MVHPVINQRILRLGGLLALLALALWILLTARVPDPLTGQENATQLAGALDESHHLAQTFTAARDGLSSVEVFAQIPPGRLNSSYTLTVRLVEADTGRKITRLVRRLVDVQADPRISLAFPPESASRGVTYRLEVTTDAPADTVSLLSSSEDIYPGGGLFQNNLPLDLDLTFRTFTAPTPAALFDALREDAGDFLFLLALTLLVGVVGWAVLMLLGHWPDPDPAEQDLWVVGVGLAVIPLVFVVLGMNAFWAFAVLVAAGMLLQVIRQLNRKTGSGTANLPQRPTFSAIQWGLALIFLWSLVVRLLQAQDVPVPMWVDGVEHAGMVERILAEGRAPEGLFYHIGYHILAALLQVLGDLPMLNRLPWVNGLTMPRMMVLLGQWLSALGGPALYLLARRIAAAARPTNGSPELERTVSQVGLLAALALSLFPSLPGYLVNWGRYPFLMGLALLPFALAAAVDALREAPSRNTLRHYGLLVLLLAGLFLTHYGTLSLWASFVLVHLMIERPAWLRQIPLRCALVWLAVLVGLGLVLLLLRFGLDSAASLVSKLGELVAQSRQASEELDYRELVRLNLRGGGLWLVITGVCGAVWSALFWRNLYRQAGGWFIFQAVLVFLQAPLLGYGLASYGNLLLALPLPLALLAAPLLHALLEGFEGIRWMVRGRVWAGAAVAALALAGGVSQVGILNPVTLLYSPADEAAMAWIRSKTPEAARFLISSTLWSGESVAADGGGWISYMTGRKVELAPPLFDLPALDAYLADQPADYVYFGRFVGTLPRAYFRASPERFSLLYQRQGIEIYRFER